MLEFFDSSAKLVGHSGSILLPDDDEITRKLAMLFEGQCEGLGPTQAAREFGYTKQRYFQLLERFEAQGALALQSKARGPKTNYRRTEEMVKTSDHSSSFPGSGCFGRGHCSKAPASSVILLAFGASSESSATLVCKKKLYACRPKSVPQQIETQRTRRKQRAQPCDPASLERAVRQLLADKISGNQVGIWLLAPEHLRLGTWDLLCASRAAADDYLATHGFTSGP